MSEVEAIERATLAAVPPEELQELEGWLLGLDGGTVGRAHSAVPMQHVAPDPELLPAIDGRYRERGLQAVFRIPRLKCFEETRGTLDRRGYRMEKPTLTQTCAVAPIAQPAAAALQFARGPGEDWASVFLGEGFDPVDGASRLAILRRARNCLFASARAEGRVAAVGAACFANGWMGIHGMRTLPAFRGRGLATQILSGFMAQARQRGIAHAFLQTEEANAAAQSVYRRAGFQTAWVYEYWRR